MALIICNKCGKNCSNTRDTCVHCGAPLRDVEKNNNQRAGNLINFDKFDSIKKLQLETEFLKTNKGACKYKQRTTFCKLAKSAATFSVLYLIAYFALQIYLFAIKDYDIANESFAIASLVLALLAPITALLFIIIEAITILSYKFSLKKYIYMKEFQRWLLERNIEYIPVFDRDSQKETFEKIDLTYMKL